MKKGKSNATFFFRSIYVLLTAMAFCADGQGRKEIQTTGIPLDPAVRYGKLRNGFTYYVRKSEMPKNKVYMYLTVKAGYFQEDKDQHQYAHLTEHMAFLGTKNYPPAASYLEQKAGLTFGSEVSAMTSGDFTKYYIILPDNHSKVLTEDALRILRDYAQYITFDPKKADIEKNVVIQEIVGRGTDENGVKYEKQFDVPYNLATGNEQIESLRHLKHSSLIQFYKDWYRPDLQAAIIVGDVDVDEMEKAVTRVFSDLKADKKPRKWQGATVPLDGKNRFLLLTREKRTDVTLAVITKQQASKKRSRQDYRQMEINSLYDGLVRKRLENIYRGKEYKAGYHSARSGYLSLLGQRAMVTRVFCEHSELLKARFQELVREVERIRRYGFSEAEVLKARENIRKTYEAEKQNINSSTLVEHYHQHFLHGEAAPDLQAEYDMRSTILNEITVEEVNAVAGNWLGEANRDIVIEASDTTGLPGEMEVLSWINDVKNEALTPYRTDNTDVKELFTPELLAKLPTETSFKRDFIEAIGVTELTLANGAKVVIKPLSKDLLSRVKSNSIELEAVTMGGTDLYPDNIFWTAESACQIVKQCGVGSLTGETIKKISREKGIGVSPYIDEDSRGIRANASGGSELESMLQLLYQYFSAPNVDEVAFQNWVAEKKGGLTKPRKSPPLQVFSDSINAISYGYDFRRLPPTARDVDSINFDKALEIYQECFNDAGRFTFVITGDLDLEETIPLVVRYLGALPFKAKRANPIMVGGVQIKSKYSRNKLIKAIYHADADKARIDFKFYALTGAQFETDYVKLALLRNILYSVLMDRLRNKEAGVYGVNVLHYTASRYDAGINISFETTPDNVDKLVAAVLDEISALKENGPDNEMLQTSKKLVLQTHLNVNNRGWFLWQKYLTEQYLYRRDPKAVVQRPVILDQLTASDLQAAARKYLAEEQMQVFKLLPEPGK